MISSADVEKGTLDLYGWLLSEREAWAGSLALCCGPVSLFAGAPAAVSLCGGTALSIGISAANAKSAQRHGGVDFVVSTLDEALRTLKNRTRERRALGVALVSELEPVLQEMVQRGVAPECVIVDDTMTKATKGLLESFKAAISYAVEAPEAEEREQKDALRHWLARKGWDAVNAPAQEAQAVREWNKRLAALIPQDDEVRHRWLRLAPLYLNGARDRVRWMWLTSEEGRMLTALPGEQTL